MPFDLKSLIANLGTGTSVVVPAGDVIDARGKFKGVNPMNLTEGARPYYGGGGSGAMAGDLGKYKQALFEQKVLKDFDRQLPPSLRGAKLPDRAEFEAQKAAALKAEEEAQRVRYIRDLLNGIFTQPNP